jgi:2'-5' RNA ligase
VEGNERLRLFCALLLPSAAVDELVRWQAAELDVVGAGVRVVPRENLHVTLAFLGGTPARKLPEVAEALRRACAGAAPPLLAPLRYRETRSVGMIVLDDEEQRADCIARGLSERLERRGLYEREDRAWLPHVTVVRFRARPRLAPSLPALGEVASSDAAVMISRLRPSGAQYEVLESVSLGG